MAADITMARTVGGEASTALMTVRDVRQRARRKRQSVLSGRRCPRLFRRREWVGMSAIRARGHGDNIPDWTGIAVSSRCT